MPGDNCSIYGCAVSRRKKYKGIGIYKVPSGDDEYSIKHREKLVAIITRNREVDESLKDQIKRKHLFICQRHYRPDQIIQHDSRSAPKPGEIPELNLPTKSFQSPPTTPRASSINVLSKRLSYQQETSSSTMTSPSYRSFDEFQKRSLTLKLPPGWRLNSISESCFLISFMDGIHMVPKYEIFVSKDLSFVFRVFLWKLPSDHPIFFNNLSSFENITLSSFISSLNSFFVCPGIDLTKLDSNNAFIKHNVPKIYSPAEDTTIASGFPLHQTEFSRSELCKILSDSSEPCTLCVSLHKKELNSLKRKLENLSKPAKPNAPVKNTAPEKIKLTLQSIRIENKAVKSENERLRMAIESNNVLVNPELNDDMISIVSQSNKPLPDFMKFFWDEQQKYLQTNKNGLRYHPSIIKFCLHLASKSPSLYDDLRYDDQTNTGILVLPSRRRLRDYKNYIRPQRGFNPGVVKELRHMVKDFSDTERFVTLSIDEMKVQEDLVWDKHNGDLIGYVDLGDPEVNHATLKNPEAIASHVLLFLVRGIQNPIKFAIANFATKDIKAVHLFPTFWKAVGILEDNCELKVVAVTSDGASANRTFYKMHSKMSGSKHVGENLVVYKTKNIFADDDDERYIHFICDQPHALKTGRNNLSHSSFQNSSRLLWNDGYYLLWDHIQQLVKDDMSNQLKYSSRLSIEHVNLTPFSRMNVRLAAQVLSESVHGILKNFYPEECHGTAEYCLMFDQFFDCVNVKNDIEHRDKQKPNLKPYREVSDGRLS